MHLFIQRAIIHGCRKHLSRLIASQQFKYTTHCVHSNQGRLTFPCFTICPSAFPRFLAAYSQCGLMRRSQKDSPPRPYSTSALYIPHGDQQNVAVVEVDIKLEEIFQNVEILEKQLAVRKMNIDAQNLVSWLTFLCWGWEHSWQN